MSTSVTIKQSNLKGILKRLPKGSLFVGIPLSAGNYDSGESIASAGVRNELGDDSPSYWKGHKGPLGVSRTPERSFMRSTFGEKHKEWAKLVADNIQHLIDDTVKPEAFIDSLGSVAVKDIRAKILDISNTPNNSQQVAYDKGFNKPLIDTGTMFKSIQSLRREE